MAFLETCRQLNLSAALERSRSGNGGHIRLFFSEAISNDKGLRSAVTGWNAWSDKCGRGAQSRAGGNRRGEVQAGNPPASEVSSAGSTGGFSSFCSTLMAIRSSSWL